MEQKKEMFPNLETIPLKRILLSQLDINLLFLFEMFLNEKEGDDEVMQHIKVQGWVQTLVKKGWINEKLEPTEFGKTMYDSLLESDGVSPTMIIKRKRQVSKTKFDEWWSIFPATDKFEWKGKKFEGSRTLRSNKEGCKLLFDKLVNSGEYTADAIIQATMADVLVRKNSSIITGTNKLTFLQNSATYLRQASFEGLIGQTPEPIKNSQTDNALDI